MLSTQHSALSTPTTLPARGWISLAEAAQRSGRRAGHLSRLCRDEWRGKGLARQVKLGKGKPTWQIHETADPKLAPVKFPEQMPADLGKYSQAARDVALFRKTILDRWGEAVRAAFVLGFNRDAATGQFLQRLFIDEGKQISRATIYNWERAWRSQGLAGLVDGRASGGSEKPVPAADPFLEAVKRRYLTLNKPRLTRCHEYACQEAKEKGWEIRSYKTCQRAIDALPPAVVIKMRFGDEAFTNDAESYIERDYSGLRSNEMWCGDHHQFDVIVSHQGKLIRPWLTAWMDMRSRMICGWEIRASDPNTDAILAAFRRGAMEHGIPESVYVDNGKDFDSYALQGRTKKERWARRAGKVEVDTGRTEGLFAGLGIKSHFAWAYHGQSKPVERFFGTLEQHTTCWATYCGKSPADKPQDLQLQLERGNAPPLADFVAWFERWLAVGYHAAGHSGDAMHGKTPAAVHAECLAVKRTAPRELLDLFMLETIGPVRVHQNGVTYKGLHYGQHEPALHQLLGKPVLLRIDARDLSRLQVWTPEGKVVCVAPSNQKVRVGASKEEVRAAIGSKRNDTKAKLAYDQARMRMHEDLPDRMLRARAAAVAEAAGERIDPATGEVLPPPSIQPVRSALEGELSALRKAMDRSEGLRPAVGAEGGAGGFVCPSMPTAPSEDFSDASSFTFHAAPPPEDEL